MLKNKKNADFLSTENITMTIEKKLSSLPIFHAVSSIALEDFVSQCTTKSFAVGEKVCKQGEQATFAMLLIEGALEVSIHTESQNRVVGHISKGEIFGEQGLFYAQETRSATVIAKEDSLGLLLDPKTMREASSSEVMVALECHLIKSLSKRLRKTNTQFQEAWQKENTTLAPDFSPPTLLARLRSMFARK